MPLTDKGKKIMSSMQRTYGGKKGEQVFYATANAGKIKGVEETQELKKGGRVRKASKSSKPKAKSKSRVNEAGNYTKPGMRKRIFNRIKAGSARVASRGSGQHVKPRCWHENTRQQGAATSNGKANCWRLDGIADGSCCVEYENCK
jgi:hypothetical protein